MRKVRKNKMIFLLLDVPFDYQVFFQDTATPIMSGILDLYDHVSLFLIAIFILVFFQIYDILTFLRFDIHIRHCIYYDYDKIISIAINKFI